jgi:lantibiotic biosynthesis protein
MSNKSRRDTSSQANHFKADDFVVLRFPVLPQNMLERLGSCSSEHLAGVVREVVSRADIREAIYLASPSLYRRMQQWEAVEGDFNDIHVALARYLLRMSYRATPFGLFSGVASGRTWTGPTTLSIPSRERMKRYVQLDALALVDVVRKSESTPIWQSSRPYYRNGTLQVKEDVLIFFACEIGKNGRRNYKRTEIERSAHVDRLMAIAENGAGFEEMCAALFDEFGDQATEQEVRAFVSKALESQLICAEDLLVLTDVDVLGTLQRRFSGSAEKLADDISPLASTLTRASCAEGSDEALACYQEVSDRLDAWGLPSSSRAPVDVDLHGGDDIGAVSKSVADKVERVFNKLVFYEQGNARFTNFVNGFIDKFGHEELPLLEVADQLGALGFLDEQHSMPYLLNILDERRGASPTMDASFSSQLAARQFLESGRHYLDVSDTAAAREPGGNLTSRSLEVVATIGLWHQGGDDPLIELKGVSRGAPGKLMGRFAKGNPAIADYLRGQPSPEGHVRAEIVYLPNDSAFNVLGRPRIAEFELRLGGPEVNVPGVLKLDDLVMGVDRRRIYLRSRSLDKLVDLRMSNAHRFNRPQYLPVYRLLNQIVNQDYDVGFPSLRNAFPSAIFVPGMKCDGIIVSRPIWRFNHEDLQVLAAVPRAKRGEVFDAMRRTRHVPDWVAIAQDDNVLPYFLGNDWMRDDLIRAMLKSTSFELTDVYPEGMTPAVKSLEGAHFHELQLTLRQPAGHQANVPETAQRSSGNGALLAGDWLYLKVLVGFEKQDALLTALRPFVDGWQRNKAIDRFFFIRYQDADGPQLRLRFRIPGEGRAATRHEICALVDQWVISGVASGVLMAPYIREVSRYGGPACIDQCEAIFHADSMAVLECIETLDAEGDTFWRRLTLAMDSLMWAIGLHALTDRIAFAKRSAAYFAAELKMTSAEKKRIGVVHSHAKPYFEGDFLRDEELGKESAMQEASLRIRQLWEGMAEHSTRFSADYLHHWRWSVVHMRVNRMTSRHPRAQEGIAWELLKRSYLRAAHVGAQHVALADDTLRLKEADSVL